MRLHGTIISVASLTQPEERRMFSLMSAHYENVRYDKFLRDLAEKDAALLLYDAERNIQGFTTFVVIETTFQGERIAALYSGDTIVTRQYWGQLELFKVFGGLFRHLLDEVELPLYWFLLSKGIKTYALLPLFFKTFYPNHACAAPAYEQALLDQLAVEKFGKFYLPSRGIMRMIPQADHLKQELSEVPESKQLQPHIRFFLERNPGYLVGDELVCLTRIELSNFTRSGLRFVTRP